MAEEMNYDTEISLIEAIFYLDTEPLSLDMLSNISQLSKDVVTLVLEKLQDRYMGESYGIELIQISGGWIISPKKNLWNFLKERYGKKHEARLSRAAMETLSIIAYSQPITRAEIEAIRGVSADNMLRLLIERNLVKEVGKKDIPGKPSEYGTTKEFLKIFRLNSIADLPKLEDGERERFEDE